MNNNSFEDRSLIEDYLPIQAISFEAAREKSVRKGHISTLHLWWARRPLVACRAAVYGALVPASRFIPEVTLKNPPKDPEAATRRKEGTAKGLGRGSAAQFVERLCKYPGAPSAIAEAQKHILEAHAERLTLEAYKPVTVEDILAGRAPRPKVLDMFAGGGAIPLEALRLGCEAYALDLNPVAHIIELCTLVYPQKYGKPDPTAKGCAKDGSWAGLAEEVRHWGDWVLQRVKKEIGDLYRPILDPSLGAKRLHVNAELLKEASTSIPEGYLMPVAYLWTRTVACKNPVCKAIVPLVRQTWLLKHPGEYIALKPKKSEKTRTTSYELVESNTEAGLGFDPKVGGRGGNVVCPFCGTTIDGSYVMAQGQSKKLGVQLMAAVCVKQGSQKKLFIPCDQDDFEKIQDEVLRRLYAFELDTGLTPPMEMINSNRPSPNARGLSTVTRHGMTTFGDLFTARQKLALLVFVHEIRSAENALVKAGYQNEHIDALIACLALTLSRVTDFMTTLGAWLPNWTFVAHLFARHAASMSWDFGEIVPTQRIVGAWPNILANFIEAIELRDEDRPANIERGDARKLTFDDSTFDAIITDPPYYDNIPYADISDFFYVWLKRVLNERFRDHFASSLSPKKSELTALSSRFNGDMNRANSFYEQMMLDALREAYRVLKPNGAMVLVYAHKTTLGWSTLVEALRRAGFIINEAWPLDTEMKTRAIAMDASALASSIFLVARKRHGKEKGQYENLVRPELEAIIRERVSTLWDLGISGADLVIACVGAGLRAFTRFEKVEFANGEEVPAERFLTEVETVVLESILARLSNEVGGNGGKHSLAGVDSPTRFYLLWRYTYNAADLDAGEVIVFANGTNVELDGVGGLSGGPRPLIEKRKGKYRCRDFKERGDDDKLGVTTADGVPAPIIDTLHRALWLMENRPALLSKFLQEAQPNREEMRLVAQALAGPALKGGELSDVSPNAELSALSKLLANWRSLIDDAMMIPGERHEKKTGQKRLDFGEENGK